MRIERKEVGAATLSAIRNAIDDLNRRTKRLKLDPITLAIGQWYGAEHVDEYGRRRCRSVVDVVIEAPDVPLKLEGWSLVGIVTSALQGDLNGDERIITRIADGGELERYRHGVVTCDECRKARLRKTMLIVRHDAGEQRIVGGACAKIYVPRMATIAYLEHLTSRIDLFGGDEDGEDGERYGTFPRGAMQFPIRETIEVALLWTRVRGYVRAAEDLSTSMLTWDALTGGLPDKLAAEFRELVATYGDLRRESDDVIAYAEAMDGASDYALNLQAAFRAGAVSSRTVGIVVSAIACYRRAQERAVEGAAPGKHADAPVGKTSDLGEGTIAGIKGISGYYGDSWIVNIKLDDGAAVVWFASKYPQCDGQDVERGERYHVRARVKEHGEFRGKPQTKVTRVSFRAPVGA